MKIVGKVIGDKELARAFRQLANEFGPRNAGVGFNVPMRKAWKPIEEEIRSTTPVDTGALKERVTLRVGRPSNRDVRDSSHLSRYTGARAETGYFWGGRYGSGQVGRQARVLEFGSRTQKPRRTLRNAFRKHRDASLEIFRREAGKQLTRRATQLGKRRAKGTLRIR